MLDLLYIGTLPPHRGGSAISMAQVLSGLARGGHRVRAVGPISEAESLRGDRFATDHPELEVHRYTVPFFDNAPDVLKGDDYYRRECAVLEVGAELIAHRRPDVVIAGRESFVRYVGDLARPRGLPFVAFAHGATTRAMVAGTQPQDVIDGLLERMRHAALVVAPARHIATSLAGLGVPDVQVVPNPVDVTRFHPRPRDARLAAELGITDGDVVVAHFSNLVPVKRPLDLSAAAALALPHDPRLLFLVVGEGPLRTELEDACAAADIGDRFRFVDWVEFESVPAYLGLAEILVQPSAAEGQAMVYLEAQASGLTLVASDIPAAREVIEDGKTGLLYPVGDVERLAEAILRAAGDPELRAELGRGAIASVQRHALPAVVEIHERLLARV